MEAASFKPIGSGFSAIQAAKYIEQGMDWKTLKYTMEAETAKSKVFYCLDTLEYLQKGGRIGLVTAMLGTALNLSLIQLGCSEINAVIVFSFIEDDAQRRNKHMILLNIGWRYVGTGVDKNCNFIGRHRNTFFNFFALNDFVPPCAK